MCVCDILNLKILKGYDNQVFFTSRYTAAKDKRGSRHVPLTSRTEFEE